jgi:hypothetical protein
LVVVFVNYEEVWRHSFSVERAFSAMNLVKNKPRNRKLFIGG